MLHSQLYQAVIFKWKKKKKNPQQETYDSFKETKSDASPCQFIYRTKLIL